jgi:hypothetical protein
MMISRIRSALSERFTARIMAATPATKGAAADVPAKLFDTVVLGSGATGRLVPGAQTSTEEP